MKNTKKFFILFLIIILLLPNFVFAFEGGEEELPPDLDKYRMRILQNGNYINSGIEGELLEDGKVLVPLRTIFENSNYEVTWEKDSKIVLIKNKDYEIKFDTKKSSYRFKNKNGHILVEMNFFNDNSDIKLTYDKANKTIIVKSPKFDKYDVEFYDLGERVMTTSLGRELKYKLNGGLSLADGENQPLVFILHGTHTINDIELSRYDLGYSYLLKDLAKNGYNALSLNVNLQYSFSQGEPIGSERIDKIFEETLVELIKANKGEENSFTSDLENKIDFENIIFIGHSRSGQEIFNIANKYKDDSRLNIKGLLSIAPSRMYDMDYGIIDIPVAIILPELDGDVVSLDGQWIFDELLDLENRRSDNQVIYLYGANHNAFNNSILRQDRGKPWYTGEIKKISQDQQRIFLKKYSRQFVDLLVRDKSIADNLKPSKNGIFGYKALVSNYKPGHIIYKAGCGYKNIINNNLESKEVTSSFNQNLNTAGLFNPPGDREDLKLLNIKWQEKNASIDFTINEKTSHDYKNLSIYLAQDSTDPINNKENQSFKVTLLDKNNKQSTILLDSSSLNLEYQDGEPIFDNATYSSKTPLSILNIPLSQFKGIDKNNLKEVSFNFTENNQGSIMLRFIELN